MSCGEKGCCCRHDDRAVYILSLCHSLSVGHIEVCVYGSCLVQCADAATAAAAAVVLSVCVLVMSLVRLYFTPFELFCGLVLCATEGEDGIGCVPCLMQWVPCLSVCTPALPQRMPHRSVGPSSHSFILSPTNTRDSIESIAHPSFSSRVSVCVFLVPPLP